MELSPQFMYRFNQSKSLFKQSVCQQVDELFESFLFELTGRGHGGPGGGSSSNGSSGCSSGVSLKIGLPIVNGGRPDLANGPPVSLLKPSPPNYGQQPEQATSAFPATTSASTRYHLVKEPPAPPGILLPQGRVSQMIKNEEVETEENTVEEELFLSEEDDCSCSDCEEGFEHQGGVHQDQITSMLKPRTPPSSRKRPAKNKSSSSSKQFKPTPATSSSNPPPPPSQPRKRYLCPIPNCGKSFNDTYMLARHCRAHSGTKPYACRWPGCHQQSSQECNLIKHIRMKHFLLPETLKRQQELGIEDTRDPKIWLEIREHLL